MFQAEPTTEAPASVAAVAKKPSSGGGFSLPSIGINTGTVAIPGAPLLACCLPLQRRHSAMPVFLLQTLAFTDNFAQHLQLRRTHCHPCSAMSGIPTLGFVSGEFLAVSTLLELCGRGARGIVATSLLSDGA